MVALKEHAGEAYLAIGGDVKENNGVGHDDVYAARGHRQKE